jgi:hypothetical protein
MINYTERISGLMRDIVARVPRLSYIDPDELLVFARHGRSGAEGAFATCHCLSLPDSDPGYYYWRDRETGSITRRSRWFVTRSPSVLVGGRPIPYLVSFTLPRFCKQTLTGARKEKYYRAGTPGWIAKLDTVVHELYHIDPEASGIRHVERADGLPSASSHGRDFLKTVADMVREYLATDPDPARFEFLRFTFAELEQRHGGVAATTFRTYPSYPQRYIEVLPPAEQLEMPAAVPIQPLKTPHTPILFTDRDITVRQFLIDSTRRVAAI